LINWGNWRVQIDLDKHDPIWINDEIKKDSTFAVAIAIIVICGVVLVSVCFISFFILRMNNKEASYDQEFATKKESKESIAVNDEHEGGEIHITK
jgi:flagellar basal body-associated protein FliL